MDHGALSPPPPPQISPISISPCPPISQQLLSLVPISLPRLCLRVRVGVGVGGGGILAPLVTPTSVRNAQRPERSGHWKCRDSKSPCWRNSTEQQQKLGQSSSLRFGCEKPTNIIGLMILINSAVIFFPPCQTRLQYEHIANPIEDLVLIGSGS